ncbi:Fic family protein [Streptomyces sp. NPDC093225]|uniref:Fic family protein n=1 Tax=Streptomyces sp. NPDC093225 TaxID=3366034 RepID=UPI003830925C
MISDSLPPSDRRVLPADPALDAEAVPAGDRLRALEALGVLARAAARLDDPDLFHRPRFHHPRRPVPAHRRHLRPAEPGRPVDAAPASEPPARAGLQAVRAVREEARAQPGRRPCPTPESLAELHRMIAASDPDVPGRGGYRRSPAAVVGADGRRSVVAVAPGAELRAHMERWYEWGRLTTSPPLDAAALAMLQLLTIHPFPAANGRTARLLAQCDLVAAGLMPGLLLDLDGWVRIHRQEHDEALEAATDGELVLWGAVFARMVTETAQHRVAALRAYERMLDEASARVAGDPEAREVLGWFRSAPAVSAEWLRRRTAADPGPALDRLVGAGILVPHPELPGALVQPRLLAVLDAPWPATSAAGDNHGATAGDDGPRVADDARRTTHDARPQMTTRDHG